MCRGMTLSMRASSKLAHGRGSWLLMMAVISCRRWVASGQWTCGGVLAGGGGLVVQHLGAGAEAERAAMDAAAKAIFE